MPFMRCRGVSIIVAFIRMICFASARDQFGDPCAKTTWNLKKFMSLDVTYQVYEFFEIEELEDLCETNCRSALLAYMKPLQTSYSPERCIEVLPSDCPWDVAFKSPEVDLILEGEWEPVRFEQYNPETDQTDQLVRMTCLCEIKMIIMRRYTNLIWLQKLKIARYYAEERSLKPGSWSFSGMRNITSCRPEHMGQRFTMMGWSPTLVEDVVGEDNGILCGKCDHDTEIEKGSQLKYKSLRDNNIIAASIFKTVGALEQDDYWNAMINVVNIIEQILMP